MPNLVPSDVHVNVPVGTERHSYSQNMDAEWRSRLKQRKKKVKQPDYGPDGVSKMQVQKKFHSAKNRRKLAAQGNALPDGSYPINDAEDLKNASILARSGHGNVAGAKILIARRAKELGVSNPMAKQPAVAKSFSAIVSVADAFFRLTG